MTHKILLVLFIVGICQRRGASAWNPTSSSSASDISRRDLFQKSASVVVVGASLTLISRSKRTNAMSDSETPRDDFMKSIERGANDEEVVSRLDALIQSRGSSSSSKVPLSDRIDGKWELIWSFGDNFSPLLQLPGPFRPSSFQYAGTAAAAKVGEGRIAQMLTGGIFGGTKAWLSSGVVPAKGREDDTLEIRPPFRLELETSPTKPKKVLVNADSDADFRAVNARSTEAQRAPPNLYQQLYLEDNGPGSLRVSKIVEGDPVIVGAILVHRKL